MFQETPCDSQKIQMQNLIPSASDSFKVRRAGSWQNRFLTDFNFRAAGFFGDFVARLVFHGRMCPEKSLQENPWQNPPKVIQQKSPRHSLSAGPGQKIHWV